MNVTTLNIKGNELTIKDSSLTSTVDEIVSAMATNNSIVADRINNLDSRAFDYNLKIINNDESVIDNIRDGLYSIKYFSVVGEGDDAVETLTDSAILIQTGTNQYRYKDGQLSSRTKTNDTWGNWMTFEGAVTSVNSMTGAVQLKAKDVKALPDYSREYLTFEALEDTTFTFTQNALQYSLDDGSTWTTLDVNTATPTVNTGNKILWKQTGLTPASNIGIGTFSATGNFKAYGNIMSLYYGDNFVGQTDLTGKSWAFYRLFNNNTKLVDASNIILPATILASDCYRSIFLNCTALTKAPELPASTLANNCYINVFKGCTSLTQAPALPATILAAWCYYSMFEDCTSLTQAPTLPATTLADRCYYRMFEGCASLTQAPALPATALVTECYQYMFQGCTSLTQAPALPATTLADSCYVNMFAGCTSLIQAPALPATTLANYCYGNMFANCTSLTQAPALPAITLAETCYSNMFQGCTSLTKAPELSTTTLVRACYASMFQDCTALTKAPALPAITLAETCYCEMFRGCTALTKGPALPAPELVYNCYASMFKDCTNLSSITCLATNISASYSTNKWLSGVAAIGTFIKADSMTSWTNGASGIPNGWTVVNYITPARYLTFRAGSDNSSFGLKTIATGHKVYYSKDLQYWKRFNTSEDVAINNGEKVYVIGDSSGVIFASSNATAFRISGSISVTGDITSILDYKTSNEKIAPYCYYGMFQGCTSLTQAPTLPATTLADRCYSQMFYGCTGLSQAPALPAAVLAVYCYFYMFNGCTALTQAPMLPATTLVYGCYQRMFNGCTALTQAPKLPAMILADSCYQSMFDGCTALTQAPTLPATTLEEICYYGMFRGCTALIKAPTLPATTLTTGCYYEMFNGCANLLSITCLATNISSSTGSTTKWLSGVASIGTFITADNPPEWSRDTNGIPSGWTVYTKSEYEVVRRYELINGITHTFYKNIVNNTISDKIKIWIDDFSDISIQEMYDNYMGGLNGHKQYHLTQGTITIDDTTYYIWEGTHDDTQYDYDAHRAYILTTTNDYDELLSQSLSEDLNNDFTSFGGFLDEDSEESYMDENNNIQYILNVEQDNDDLYIYVDNIQIKGFDDGETISDYVNDPEGSGCNPYELTSDTIEIDGESYYIWERNDDNDGQYDNIRYLLTTTIDRATLESTSVETSSSNLIVKQNNCIYGLMSVDNEMYDVDEADKNVIVKVE